MIPNDLQQVFVENLSQDQVVSRVLGYFYTRPYEQYRRTRRMLRLLGTTISFRKDTVEICKRLMDAAMHSTKSSIFTDTIAVVRYSFFNRNPYSGKDITSENKSDFEKKNGYYPYIPLNPDEFVKGVMEVMEKNFHIKMHLKFIDVGCGIGDKSLFAYLMGAQSSTGIEYNKHTFELAKYFLKDTEVQLIKGDALKHKHYSDYNLVYMYNPIANWEIELKLLETIYEQLKHRSAILYFGGGRSWQTFKKSLGTVRDNHSTILFKEEPNTKEN